MPLLLPPTWTSQKQVVCLCVCLHSGTALVALTSTDEVTQSRDDAKIPSHVLCPLTSQNMNLDVKPVGKPRIESPSQCK